MAVMKKGSGLFSRLRISHRIAYITTFSIVLYLVAAVIGWLGLHAASASLRTVYEDRAKPMQELAQIEANIREDSVNILFAFENAPGRPASGLLDDSLNTLTQAVHDNHAAFDSLWQAYMSSAHTAEEEKLVAVFLDKHAAWRAKLDATLTQIEGRKLNDTVGLLNFLYAVREERQAALDALNQLMAYQASVAQREYQAADERYTVSRVLLVVFFVLSGLFVGLPAVLTWKYITRSLRRAGDAASAIADGDLVTTIEHSGTDEIGELMGRLARMRGALHDLVAAIRGNVESLSRQADELSSAAGTSASAIESQSQAASSMAAAVEQLSVSIDQVGDNAREAHSVSQNSSVQAAEGGRIIHDTAGEMQRVADAVNNTAGTIRELEQFSTQISGIVQVIKEISDQTNLLALNAAIEAARAGEQGRGFAVVADEVRKLAERTSISTQEISEVIDKIQEGTQGAVREMEAGVARVTEGVQVANQAGDSVSTLQESAERAAAVVENISRALSEQTAAARDVARKVDTIAQSTEQNNRTVQKTAASARALAELSSELSGLAGRFRIS
ncbi:methyl-accepting chemotaxis protein [Nitrogeniibacter mangrovi]|uniref:Methyl-accepting chemotaxis protein n=1 Tax=Nitrogeniibacter mangrovi TaxID=2016596 RepID=A0A6C1B621_9RHOO|nr:methyl-accepting chemotaxis protein [Nitrogeniibacter mangrovi]QID19162.1 methyl-accepting chemotaxis protein [Nitrogeniibacter mangrovi]